jgi:EmrB/QacA subfamily drug resistance transporter
LAKSLGTERKDPDVTPEPGVHYDDRRWWTLAVLCLSLVIVIIGNTSLNVTLPRLVTDLDATSSQLQWIVDSYALVFAGLLLTAGALGDRFGRKGSLQIGLVIFGVGAIASAFMDSATALIATRAVMGLGAAFIMPATLSILTNIFPPHERARAIAIWAGLSASGAALGPIASGLLLEQFWWGSVFLINGPVVLAALVTGHFLVPRSRDPHHIALDPVGAGLSIVGMTGLLFAIIEAPDRGWAAPETLAAFVGAAVLLGLFAAWELHTPHPMLDLRYFRNPQFSAASGAITLVFFAMFGTFFLMTQLLQLVRGYTPLGAGVFTLPMPITLMIIAPRSTQLVERFGRTRVVTTGLVIVAAGLSLLSTVDVDTPAPVLLAALVILAVGMASIIPPATTSIMTALPLGKAGVGSAVNDTTRELGGALGVAVLGSVMAARFQSLLADTVAGLPAEAREAATSSLGAALEIADRIGAPGAGLADAARSAYVDGLSTATIIAAVVVLVAALVVHRFLPAAEQEPAVVAPVLTEPVPAEA